ncbi:anthranilate synthase component I family protein [Leptospira congkakensis]|uniref:Anthranilate synthase component I family protein n=1 Tax=Leptospira congkakensis TaxID=2484932 RepID=A0A4Z0ZZG4_9LEPT|nr:anthranilate synthase component I family protein [Leptospira congkakensis]TGL86570.1 anthranilate synthase component I family protein [Leptospira congkakensis]TGL93885.1 anthranilate synthase component I family protein [Leptospira congkakensis]TGL94709.1 anthranilate synthase component I family protein [Leptospira congkakensis]
MTQTLPKIKIPKKPNYASLSLPEGIEFWELFRVIEAKYENCFLLESAGDNQYDSRYSVMGFDPSHLLVGETGVLEIDGKKYSVENPYFALRELVDYNSLSISYAGGFVGYLGYQSMQFFEPKLKLEPHPDFPAMIFGLYLDGLIYDKFTGELIYFDNGTNRIEEVNQILNLAVNQKSQKPKAKVSLLQSGLSKEVHKQMVEEALEEVRAGNTFQCQIGFEEIYKVDGNPLAIYETLREINPSPHMYYVKFGTRAILGASPELLFRLRQGEMESFPLAGTTKRGVDAKEDTFLARKLLTDPKEIAEHNMLIDLHRNDVGRVAKFGTVKVRRRFDVKRFSHVQHISSEVVGILSSKEDMFSGLASSFPAGTLSGAPKIESMKIIERIEKSPRGPYGGAVGSFGLNGDCTFAIPIRSFFVNGNKGFVRASGGIVFDSKPEDEYQEIINKMASVRKALDLHKSE